MKIRTISSAAAIGLACLTLAGCVDGGQGYVGTGYVYDNGPYYGGSRDHWRYRERNWDRDRNWDRRPGRPDWHHASDRPEHAGRPDRYVRPDSSSIPNHGGRNGWSGDTAGHAYTGRPDRIIPDGQ